MSEEPTNHPQLRKQTSRSYGNDNINNAASIQQARKEKRKSDMFIAAKSLDNELQSVQNLKRLSIGSMDLLIDPELEFRVNNNNNISSISNNNNNLSIHNSSTSPSSSFSASSSSSSSSSFAVDTSISLEKNISTSPEISTNIPNTINSNSNNNDITQDTEVSIEDSIDVTQSEYLHDEATLKKKTQNDMNIETSNDQPNSLQRSSHRSMSGVGSLKRNGLNRRKLPFLSSSYASTSSTSKQSILSSQSEKDPTFTSSSSSDNLTPQNLLWVPANQHPNIKPESYLELVQDTLHNIHLDDDNHNNDDAKVSTDDDLYSMDGTDETNKENLNIDYLTKPSTSELRRKNKSLVRRPSGLRKSYTEFEEFNTSDEEDETSDCEEEQQLSTDNSTNNANHHQDIIINNKTPEIIIPKGNTRSSRFVSLKDITEELTKISNNAGLTDSDAITLARTLSMAGSFQDNSNNNHNSDNFNEEQNGNTPEDDEYASNMFMKNGLTIPTRSSLRRSRFNTYRIRSGSSSTSAQSSSSSRTTSGSQMTNNNKTVTEPGRGNQPEDHNNTPASHYTARLSYMSTTSPGSISDLYDHYQNSDSDVTPKAEQQNNNNIDKLTASNSNNTNTNNINSNNEQYNISSDLSHASVSQDSSFLSNESSNNSILIKPQSSQSMLQENIDNQTESPACELPVDSTRQNNNEKQQQQQQQHLHKHANDDKNQKQDQENNHLFSKRNGWHWSSQKNPIESNTELSQANQTTTNNKSRHLQFFSHSADLKDESTNSSTTDTDTSTLAQKKETFDKKFAKLFKRKSHENKNILKTKSSNSSLSKFRKHAKKSDTRLLSNTNKVGTSPPPPSSSNITDPDRTMNHQSNSEKTSLTPTPKSKSLISKVAPVSIPTPTITISPSSDFVTQSEDINDERNKNEDLFDLPALQPAVSFSSTKTTTSTSNNEIDSNKSSKEFVETVREIEGDDSQELSGGDISYEDNNIKNQLQEDESVVSPEDHFELSQESIEAEDQTQSFNDSATQPLSQQHGLPPRKLTFDDVKRPERPNAPVEFTDSAFGFPLPALTVSTVIMFDHRLGINVERAIYRLSHLKLSDSKRELREQVLLSNFMYAYLNLVNHTLYMEQVAQQETIDNVEFTGDDANDHQMNMVTGNGGIYNDSNGSILIPDI
ncbi:Zds2p NDAI_0E00350 [Naumovozyma dairenensis CBS 421]|uniref:Protein Zds1 C-terminal domain-containing protein n=1 Tax=Naumovozyma dairenensis (strain ATCC 10597 / BCRC 20456 / CBS 421 / NBRC 0211 / NRRL Y-12639) TaxID=1071378 RepID=G0WAT1_NAUDC|nr:hypothetical protein NDAI_0E00350 [Naumovozyma dairenensis CBS 421]CCD24851.1 hypothetical protein NDAI_0E00350 [Naumovozyma dairenensis CBS 421]